MTKKITFSFLIIFCLFLFVLPTFANNYGLDAAAAETTLSKTPLTEIIGNGIATVLSFLGIVFFGLLVYAGFNWMTARGNAEKSSSALDTIIDALIGIIIILSAYVATQFVFSNLKPANTPSSNKTVDSCATTKGDAWACKAITSCGLTLTDAKDINAQRSVCEANPTKCALNLCSGGLENVCCSSIIGPPVPECTTNEDCEIGENCVESSCVFVEQANKKIIGETCAQDSDCSNGLTCLTKFNAFNKSCEAVCTENTDCPTGYTTCSFNPSNEGPKYCMQ